MKDVIFKNKSIYFLNLRVGDGKEAVLGFFFLWSFIFFSSTWCCIFLIRNSYNFVKNKNKRKIYLKTKRFNNKIKFLQF